jgi:hypothetical protein
MIVKLIKFFNSSADRTEWSPSQVGCFTRGERSFSNNVWLVIVGGLVVIVFAIGPKVHGFKPGQGRWIFKGDKNLQHASLWMGSKAMSMS